MSTRAQYPRYLARAAVAVLAAGLVVHIAANRPGLAQTQHKSVQWSVYTPYFAGGYSGKINAFAYNPSDPKVMYIGGGWGNSPRESPAQTGIYRTVDGTHWTAINNGLTNPDGTISSTINGLWLDPANPSIVLAATEFGGTFRSTDAGTTWANVDRAEATQFSQAGSVLYLAARTGILKSTDDGASWVVSLRLSAGATTVVTAGGATYAGTTSGDVYRLTSSSWTRVGHPGTGATHNIAVDPFNTNVVYANVDDRKAWNENLYGSLDGGRTWRRIRCLCRAGAQAIAFSLVVPHRFYLGYNGGAHLYYFEANGSPHPVLHHGTSPLGGDMRYVIPAPGKDRTDDACYLLMDQGLFYSPRCASGRAPGISDLVPDFLSYGIALTPDAKGLVVPLQDWTAIAGSKGRSSLQFIARSGEGGEAFINPFNPKDCYFAHPDLGLYSSFDGCNTFSVPSGTFGPGYESLAFDPANANTVYAVYNADTGSAQVSVSVDEGRTWTPSAWHFRRPYQVVVSPIDANTIVVAAGETTSPPALYYTHDGGTTWHKATGLQQAPAPDSTIYYPAHRLYAAVAPNSSRTVLLVDHDPSTDNILIYRSVDGAATFSHTSTLVQPVPQRPWPNLLVPTAGDPPDPDLRYYATRFYGNRLAFNPQPPQHAAPAVVVTTRFGAYVSFDTGSHWHRIDGTAIPHHFVGVTWRKGYVYLASFGEGVISSSIPLQ